MSFFIHNIWSQSLAIFPENVNELSALFILHSAARSEKDANKGSPQRLTRPGCLYHDIHQPLRHYSKGIMDIIMVNITGNGLNAVETDLREICSTGILKNDGCCL